ncbi:uncharacterized protein J3R85_017670 [Psidium guajava]|nr:uncharacterized protein J3R85_017670 [Psidium guajava]
MKSDESQSLLSFSALRGFEGGGATAVGTAMEQWRQGWAREAAVVTGFGWRHRQSSLGKVNPRERGCHAREKKRGKGSGSSRREEEGKKRKERQREKVAVE